MLILGAAGGMGACATRYLARVPGLDELRLADRDVAGLVGPAEGARAEGVAAEVVDVDVQDGELLARAIDGCGLVVNTVGPFYRFGVPILTAAITAGVDYVDICDDWEPTIAMLALDPAAAEAGSTCVIGAGASPGASNLLAKLAAERLDAVDDAFTAWPVDVGDDSERAGGEGPAGGAPGAATVHWVQQLSGTIKVVERGLLVDQAPLQPIELVVPGYGRGTVYTVGHPEPVTLARPDGLSVAGRSATAMVVTPATVAFLDDLRRRVDRGQLSIEEAAAAVERPGVVAVARAALRSVGMAGPGDLPGFFALVRGTADGQGWTVAAIAAMPDRMDEATAAPLAVIAGHLVDGSVEARPGVHAPEAVVDPHRFFDDLDRTVAGGVAIRVTSEGNGRG